MLTFYRSAKARPILRLRRLLRSLAVLERRDTRLLKTEVNAEDVGEAALFLAGPRSAKITGAMLPMGE